MHKINTTLALLGLLALISSALLPRADAARAIEAAVSLLAAAGVLAGGHGVAKRRARKRRRAELERRAPALQPARLDYPEHETTVPGWRGKREDSGPNGGVPPSAL